MLRYPDNLLNEVRLSSATSSPVLRVESFSTVDILP